MTRKRRLAGTAGTGHQPPRNYWASLTWDDVANWAGERSVSRGRTYQREGRVHDLAVSDDGRLLGTVLGSDRYSVSVWWEPDREGANAISSRCICPVGANGCKHAVAVVAAYLKLLAQNATIPAADPEDPRWASLASNERETGVDQVDANNQKGDLADLGHQASSRNAGDEKIQSYIEAKSREELAEMVWSLTKRFPDLREEFQERIALGQGDVKRLMAEVRQELRRVNSKTGWRNQWTGEGHTPDYSRLKHRLERMVELGHPDAVLQLGQEIIARGMEQIGQSDDEGETASEFANLLPVIFKAAAESSVSPTHKLLFAIDALLQDDYSLVESDDPEVLLSRQFNSGDWSAAADELSVRLKVITKTEDDFHRRYERDRITNWLMHCLSKSGRDDEVLALCEREARLTGSYERQVNLLIQRKRYEEAEGWATEGIAKTAGSLPGIASNLAKAIGKAARLRGQWEVAAAHAAWEFFNGPGRATFEELVKASDRAGCREIVQRLALQFLETGVVPISITTSRDGSHRADVTKGWPLPLPNYLLPLLAALNRARSQPRYDVLIDMAMADHRLDEVLRWYDKMCADSKLPMETWMNGSGGYADRVAAAVAQSHPERALEIYRQRLDGNLTRAHVSAYEAAAAYLRKLQPILRSLHREEEWTQIVADIRLRYRNRPRLIEILDRLDSKPILQLPTKRY